MAGNEQPDFVLQNHGSISLLRPITDEGREWVQEHIPEDAQRMGASVAIEARYVPPIVEGIQNDGLTLRLS